MSAAGDACGGLAPGVVAVVIGRNEGARLVRCIESVRRQVERVVYVDSGSSDGSAERARELGAHVVALSGGPFTAARGRQAGIDEAQRLWPTATLVQFIDGDCVLREGWVAAAMAYLADRPRVAGVMGRRRETRTAESFWSRVVDLEWEMPEGRVICHGGDALDRLDALRQIGGWSTDLIAGEDPDLGFRLRDAGWEVHCIRVEMTGHDIAMRSLGAYLKRARRSGHAYAEVGWRHRRGSGRVFLRRTASILFYGAVVPAMALVSAVVWWPALAVPLALWGRLALALARVARRQGAGWSLALGYAAVAMLGKVAAAVGVGQYAWNRMLRRPTGLIEYKGPAAASTEGA